MNILLTIAFATILFGDIGLWSEVNVVSYNTSCRYRKHKGRSGPETQLDSRWQGMGGNGRLDL